MISEKKFPSELRYDPISQGWVVIATGRARRPETFKIELQLKLRDAKKDCPFESFASQEQPTLAFYNGKRAELREGKYVPQNWTTVVLPNKYPAFLPHDFLHEREVGPYRAMDGVGFHEVVLTRDHTKDIPEFSVQMLKEMFDVYQERYLDLMNEKFVDYIAIFKNKGQRAGASLSHPHSQIIAAPVLNPDIQRSLAGSLAFFKERHACAHCMLLEWDLKEKTRVVFENDCYAVVCPFASRMAFEVRIFPKKHLAYFERIEDEEKKCLAEAFLATFKKLDNALNKPDYNYFLHTAPADGKQYDHYHWHWEVLPKTSTWAGFEISTGIEISTIAPETAAEFLRKH